MVAKKTRSLLKQVRNRLHMVSYAKGWYLAVMFLGIAYASILLISRMTGLVPNIFVPLTLSIIPVAALLVALIVHHRPVTLDAARVADDFGDTKDLFLTVTDIEKTPGEYQSIVIRDAENKAENIKPALVVPMQGGRQFGHVVGMLIVLAVGALYLPQFDPFGKVAKANAVKETEKKILASQKQTEMRIEKLMSEKPAERQSEEVKRAIDDLKATFNKMQHRKRKYNLKKLSQNQKQLGEKFRKLNTNKLSSVLKKNPMSQQFGTTNKKLEQWKKEFKEGSIKGLKNELASLKEELKELAKTDDPLKQAELKKKMQKKLQNLKKFAEENFDSPQLTAAVKRAQKQLGMASDGSNSSKSLESLSKSADLLEMELNELALNAKDLKALEEALKTLQMAKILNNQDMLDGKNSEGMEGMAEYAELYAKMCEAGMCQGEGCKACKAGTCMGGLGPGNGGGGGMGGPGQGRGGVAGEDNSSKSGFKTERVRTTVTAGKMLMSMKIKGLGELNKGREEYVEAVNQVKQGVSEALNSEQIPPGYHEGVKKYFDSIQPGPSNKTEPTSEK